MRRLRACRRRTVGRDHAVDVGVGHGDREHEGGIERHREDGAPRQGHCGWGLFRTHNRASRPDPPFRGVPGGVPFHALPDHIAARAATPDRVLTQHCALSGCGAG